MKSVKEYKEEKKKLIEATSDIKLLDEFLNTFDLDNMREFRSDDFLKREPTAEEKLLFKMHWFRVHITALVTKAYQLSDNSVLDLLEAAKENGYPLDMLIGSAMPDTIGDFMKLQK